MEQQDALRAAGVDAVIVYCVNDAAVMQAWAKDQKIGLVSTRSRLSQLVCSFLMQYVDASSSHFPNTYLIHCLISFLCNV